MNLGTSWWQRHRQTVFYVKGRRCYICGGYADTVDHVRPRAHGGGHELSNLEPCCQTCNLRRAAHQVNSQQGRTTGALSPPRGDQRSGWRRQSTRAPVGVIATDHG